MSPISSSMVAPALASIASDFAITNSAAQQMPLSIFVLAYGLGPLVSGPLSELYGRVPILQLANLIYLVFNTACGFAQSATQLIIFRFLAGIGGSAPLAIGGGVLSDVWRADERGAAVAIYSLMPLLGPALGPLAGGFITTHVSWRWIFYAASIADAGVQLAGLFFLRETYMPTILRARAARRRRETGNSAFHSEWERSGGAANIAHVLAIALRRPFILLATQPIVQMLALYMAYVYGLMYLVLSTFPLLWVQHYNQRIDLAGLHYLALGLGFFLGAQISSPLNDRVYRALKRRAAGIARPEFRVPLLLPASVLLPLGLFVYGWTAQLHTHWIGPDVGAAIFAAGSIVCFAGVQTYIMDAYTLYAASAIAAATVLRSLAGFAFPLFVSCSFGGLHFWLGRFCFLFDLVSGLISTLLLLLLLLPLDLPSILISAPLPLDLSTSVIFLSNFHVHFCPCFSIHSTSSPLSLPFPSLVPLRELIYSFLLLLLLPQSQLPFPLIPR